MSRSDDLKNRLDELFSSLPQPEPGEPPRPQRMVPEPADAPRPEASPPDATPTGAGLPLDVTDMSLAFETMAVGMVLTGVDGRILRVNPAFGKMLGYLPSEIAQRSFQELTHPDDVSIGGQALQAMLSGATTAAVIEQRYLTKDGRVIWVELNITLITDEAGQPKYFVTVVSDITGRKRIERMLDKRVCELNCLNDIGHKIDEGPALPEFFEWIAGRIPAAFQDAEVCVAAVEHHGSVYGNSAALTLPSKIVGGLRVNNELVGWLHVAYTLPHGFADAESALMGSIVSRVSSYIENQGLLDRFRLSLKDTETVEKELEKRAELLATVAKVSTTVATLLDPQQLIQNVADLTKESFELYHTHIFLIDESGTALIQGAGAFEVGRLLVQQGWNIPLESPHSLAARAARQRRGVIVNDVTQDPDYMASDLLPDTRSELATPIIAGDRLLGVLDVQSDCIGHFRSEDISIMTALASQVAVALQNANQYQQARQSENLVRSIIDATPDWIFIKDQEHRYRLVNTGYSNSLHIPIDAFIGKDDLDLGFPEELVKGNPEKGIRGFWADDRGVMESGQQQVYPNDPATIDGKVHVFHTIKTPLRNERGEIWGVLAFARDVTEREELLAEMSAFADSLGEMNEMAARLNLARDEREILATAAAYTARLLDVEETLVGLVDPGGQMLELSFLGEQAEMREKMLLPVQGSAGGKSMLENRLIAWPEEEPLSNYIEGEAMASAGVQALLAAPLQVHGQVIGVFNAVCLSRDNFTANQKTMMAQISALLSSALQNHRLLARASAQAQRDQALQQITTRVRTPVDADTILRTAVRELGDALGRKTFIRLGLSDGPVPSGNGHSPQAPAGDDAGNGNGR